MSKQKLGRHLSNIPDPKLNHPRLYSSWAYSCGPAAMREEEQQVGDWIARNIIGPPKGTPHYTVEQLKSMGMVGIYSPEES